MLINVFFPHVLATISTHRYTPGVATGVAVNFPVTAFLLSRAFAESYVAARTFAATSPLTVVVLLVSIPMLFAIGRKLTTQ